LRAKAAVEARSRQTADSKAFHQIILFLEDGWLDRVEIVYYSDEPPRTFPPPADFDPPFARA
jgi:hypothetical protein